MFKNLGVAFVMMAVWSSGIVSAEVVRPGGEVMSTIDQLRKTVIKEKNKLSEPELEKRLTDQILPRFDFHAMSQSSLGPAWRTATEDQRKEFMDLFTDLLVRTYIAKIRRNLETAKISLGEEKIQGDRAIVRTNVDDGKDTIKIDYRLRLNQGDWHVYDVIVENVGLVTNYRNEFSAIIQREKMDGLLVKLREKKIKVKEEREED